jgi:hypothetical protein
MRWYNCYTLKISCPICNDNAGARKNNTRCSVSDDGSYAICYYVHAPNATKTGSGILGNYSVYKLKDINEDLSAYVQKKEKNYKVVSDTIADLKMRDLVYSQMILESSLNQKHQEYLTRKNLEHAQYISIEHSSRYRIPKRIMNSLSLPDLKGIPGFAIKNGHWYLYGVSGLAMPCITIDNQLNMRIAGFQIRSDDEQNNLRYSWLSSKKHGGTQMDPCPHISLPPLLSDTYIIITEGIKKADISANILRHPVVGLPGVGCQVGLIEQLDRLLKILNINNRDIPIRIAYDMDIFAIEEVQKAFKKLVITLKKAGYTRIQQTLWDTRFKGLDDFLLENSKRNLIARAV